MLTNTRFYLTIILFSFPYLVKATPECEQQWIAKLVSANGRVEKQHYRHSEWNTVKKGEYFCQGDRLRTNRHSRVTIELGNESLVTLEQSSTLSFPILNKSKFSWILDLFEGGAFFRSRRPHQLEVDTPFVNAVHEGTEFLIRVTNQQTEITVFDGRVAAENKAGRVLINEHQIGTTGKDQITQIKPLTIHPKDAVQWALYYPPIVDFQNLEAILAFQPALENYKQGNIYHTLQSLEKIPQRQRDEHFFALKASLLLTVGSVNEALQEIEHAQQLKATSSAALAIKSIIAVTKNQQQEALKLAKKATELNPSSAVSQIALSYALQAAFKISEALKATQQAIKLDPGNALAWARLAELQLSSGERSDALESAKKAQQLNPQLDRTQTVLGFAYLAQIDIDEAKTAFNKAINLNSADPLAWLGIGLAKIRKGDIKEGTRDIEAAVTLDPDNAIMRSYLGKAYYELRNEGYAATELAIAKEMDPNDPTPWFYDAILKQTTNRPIEALHDMQKAIELNDNRGVYRSRLLLDEDLAARAVSLARIYDDLGFDNIARLNATKSLDNDPKNHSAHRFLSDALISKPRHEIARASEILQSQLLQPINTNPIQPTLLITDLNIIDGIGPAESAFREYTPMFESNGVQLVTTGLIGSNDTFADETVITGLHNRFSYSLGQFHYETNGFRKNNDLEHDLYNIFGQLEILPGINVQGEFRHRKTKHGDLELKGNPDDFGENNRRKLKQQTYRFGTRIETSKNSDFIFSLIYSDRDELTTDNFPENRFSTENFSNTKGYQIEAQHLFNGEGFNSILGGGTYQFDVVLDSELNFGSNFCPPFPPILGVCNSTNKFTREQHFGYLYSQVNFPKNIYWTLGFSFDSFRDNQGKEALVIEKWNPKLGLRWDINNNLTFRAAAFRTVKSPINVNQLLQPTQIAGFNQFFDYVNGTEAKQYSFGMDLKLKHNFSAGMETIIRTLKVPSFNVNDNKFVIRSRREEIYLGYLNWTPAKNWALTAEYRFEKFKQDDPTLIETSYLPISIRYFNEWGFFSEIKTTYVNQLLENQSDENNFKNDFILLDAAIGLKLPNRRGIISLEAKNLLDTDFYFRDRNFQMNEIRAPEILPEQTLFARITFNF